MIYWRAPYLRHIENKPGLKPLKRPFLCGRCMIFNGLFLAALGTVSAHVGLFDDRNIGAYFSLKNDIESHGKFSKFKKAIESHPDIEKQLRSKGSQFTIIAPNNEAFKDIDLENMEKEDAKKMIEYHIIPQRIERDTLHNGFLAETLRKEDSLMGRGQVVKFQRCPVTGNYSVGNDVLQAVIANFEEKIFDQPAIEIDRILVPPKNMVSQMLKMPSPRLTMFYAAIDKAGLGSILESTRGLTVFAPNDNAFFVLDSAVLRLLFSPMGEYMLKRLIMFHIVPPQPRQLYSDDMPKDAAMYQTMLPGRALRLERKTSISLEMDTIVLNDQSVVVNANVLCKNGVLHVIDRLLLPKRHWAPMGESIQM